MKLYKLNSTSQIAHITVINNTVTVKAKVPLEAVKVHIPLAYFTFSLHY